VTRTPWRSVTTLAALFILFLIAGCATQKSAISTFDSEKHWSGRILLKADTQPPTQVTAVFELNGTAQQGRLALSTPLGTTLATAHWQPGVAELRGMGDPKVFATLDELTEAMTGTRLPVAALFAWLDGHPQTADGWLADLEQVPAGRLNARRISPPPSAEIRLVFEPSKQSTP
jgi:outer membrane lipoprotein LolB